MGDEAFNLGLLTEIEPDPQEENQQQAYSFSHLIFQEFAAGKFAAILDLVRKRKKDWLNTAFTIYSIFNTYTSDNV